MGPAPAPITRSLLDTDIFSEVMKGRNANVVRAAGVYLAAHGRLTISAVTVLEVSYGLRRAGRTEQLAAFEAMLPTIEVLPLGDAAGLLAGHMKADLEARGTPIGASDVMIAAVAITSGIPLVTGNVAHFEFVRAAGQALTTTGERDRVPRATAAVLQWTSARSTRSIAPRRRCACRSSLRARSSSSPMYPLGAIGWTRARGGSCLSRKAHFTAGVTVPRDRGGRAESARGPSSPIGSQQPTRCALGRPLGVSRSRWDA